VKYPSILFINQSSGYLMIDIIESFQDIAEQRALAAGLVNPRNKSLGDDVKVEPIITYDRSSTFRRITTWTIGFLQTWWLVLTRYRKAHLFIVSNPPLAPLLPLFCKNSFSLLIYDVYPDALEEYKVLSSSNPFIRLWKRWNKRIFPRAHSIFTLNGGMKSLLSQYVAEDRIEVVPVWTDNSFLQPIPKDQNTFRKEQGLQDYFLITYSGNLGKSHELSVLVDLAEKLQADNVFVLIIGGGDQYKSLKTKIDASGLANIRLLPWQPTEKLPQTLSAADLGVVSLGKEASALSMPSKTFNLLSVGCPILAIAEPDAALSKFIDRHQVGKHFTAAALQEIAEFVRAMTHQPEKHARLCQNALLASLNYGPDNAEKFVRPYKSAGSV
jgi:glycosyltransferase involved in cell wall biosynthesis